MSTSLSKHFKNLSERIHSNKLTDCKSKLDSMSFKDNQLIFRCFECKNNCKKHFNKELINRFSNTYRFGNGDLSKFTLLSRKDAHP